MTAKRKQGGSAGNSGEQRGRPFSKGESGNPRGRPKGFAGLAAAIREETDGGLELARIAISIARGEAFQTPPSRPGGRKGKRQFPKFKDRMEAVKWLSDRGFGKPMQSVEVSGNICDSRSVQIAQAIADAHPELAEVVFGAAVAGRLVAKAVGPEGDGGAGQAGADGA